MNRTRYATYFLEYTPPGLCAIEGDGAAAGGGSTVTPAPDGNAGGGDSGVAGAAAPAGPNWSEFIGSLGTLNESLGGKLDTLVNEVRTVAAPQAAPYDPPDVEAMSRPELVAHIVGTIGEAVRAQIAEALTPLADQVQNLQLNTATTSAIADRDRLRSENKDFDEWKDDMVVLAKQVPYAQLGLPDLYALAKSRNPAKAATLTAKYNPPPAKPAPRWGGLTPTGGAANGTPVLSSRDAGIEAYREVSAKYPGVLAVLEGM
jgi:hypothetical protein